MALIDVVKWEVNKQEFCHKFPSNDLRIGSQLVVYPALTAFFVKGGKILDEFTEGTYTLKSENLPLLNKLINLPFGGNSPFQAEVWFVNQITRLDFKWGTPSPIQLEDPKYKIIVPVRAYGQYGIKIVEPRKFLETLMGNMSTFTANEIDSYFKGRLIANLNSTITKKIVQDQISILDINAHLVDISDFCNTEINDKFTQKYGINLVDFSVMSINVPEDDDSFIQLKEAKATLARMNIAGRDVYQMERSFDVLEKAAANEGGGMQMMGVGMGLGFGNAIGSVAGQMINTNPVAPPPVPSETQWFVYVNGQQLGGQTMAHISAMMAQGSINGNTLVWKPGMANWAPLSSVPELSGLIVTPPPVPPTPPAM